MSALIAHIADNGAEYAVTVTKKGIHQFGMMFGGYNRSTEMTAALRAMKITTVEPLGAKHEEIKETMEFNHFITI